LSRPLLSPRTALFPYTTLFRSDGARTIHRQPELVSERFPLPRTPRARARQELRNGYSLSVCGLLQHPLPNRFPRVSLLEPLLERSEEHTSELQSRENLVCRLLL